jgi:hypothetical protein
VGFSSSSLATIATPEREPRQRKSVSFAMTSSFCWRSPCTFSPSSEPSTSWMRARRILSAMTFADSASAERIHENVPLACGCFCSSARMCDCSVVRFSRATIWRTDVGGVSTMAAMLLDARGITVPT